MWDSGTACVRFISPQGNILKTIGKGIVVVPHNCVVHKDKIFVSDRDANLIKVYTDNGRFLYARVWTIWNYGWRDTEPRQVSV